MRRLLISANALGNLAITSGGTVVVRTLLTFLGLQHVLDGLKEGKEVFVTSVLRGSLPWTCAVTGLFTLQCGVLLFFVCKT